MIHFLADRGDARLRLDQMLVRRLDRMVPCSRTTAQRWIAAGLVRINGATAFRSAMRAAEGDAVDVALPDDAPLRSRPEAEPGPLTVLHEDADLLIASKPAGQVVHPSYRNTSGTLLNAVLWHVRERDGVQPGILTRLDRETSGVVVVALGPHVHAALQRQAVRGGVVKEYLAVVRAASPPPAAGDVRFPLGRDPDDRRRVVVREDGAASHTRVEALASRDGITLLRCTLVTGRTHQIRVHLSASGWPIVGDPLYGVPDPRIARQALHAWRVRFTHPVTGDPVRVEAPVPDDMAVLVPTADTMPDAPR